jgi:diguanylate cyclase (GGDEF)-like protein
VAGQRYTLAYYASHGLLMLAGLVMLVSAIQTLVASRSELASAEMRIALLEPAARQSARRIRALGELFRSSGAPVGEAACEMLRIASVCLRPGKTMFARLSRLEGRQVIVLATIDASEGATSARSNLSARRFALEGSTESHLLAGGGTQALHDAGNAEWRSCIGASYIVGEERFFLVFGSPDAMHDDPFAEDDVAYVDVVASIFSDVATQRYLHAQEAFRAEHDALTGLPKRSLLHREIREAIEGTHGFSVALTNLDGFRYINDRDGHDMGDRVLSQIANGLRSVAGNGFVARIGGDEFGILLPSGITVESAIAGVAPYAAVFREPMNAGDHRSSNIIAVNASIGIARYPRDGRNVEDLLRRASVALDVAKQRGGSTTVVFDKSMETILRESHLRLVELTDAIFGNQLLLEYQPPPRVVIEWVALHDVAQGDRSRVIEIFRARTRVALVCCDSSRDTVALAAQLDKPRVNGMTVVRFGIDIRILLGRRLKAGVEFLEVAFVQLRLARQIRDQFVDSVRGERAVEVAHVRSDEVRAADRALLADVGVLDRHDRRLTVALGAKTFGELF